MNAEEILREYCPNDLTYHVLVGHGLAVYELVQEIDRAHGLRLDCDFMRRSALLHDIGCVRVHAPKMGCMEPLPYICHGVEGAKIMRSLGDEACALICERHIGAGLSREDIVAESLPLPVADFLPQTVPERLLCYADNFFSKTPAKLTQRAAWGEVIAEAERWGEAATRRLLALHAEFGLE